MRSLSYSGFKSLCAIIATLSITLDNVAFGQMMLPKPDLERQLITRLAFLNASPASGMFWLVGSGLGDLSNVTFTAHKIEGNNLRLVAQKQSEFLAEGDQLSGRLALTEPAQKLIVCVAFEVNAVKTDIIRFYSMDSTEWPPVPNARRFRASANEQNGSPRMCSDVKASAARFLK